MMVAAMAATLAGTPSGPGAVFLARRRSIAALSSSSDTGGAASSDGAAPRGGSIAGGMKSMSLLGNRDRITPSNNDGSRVSATGGPDGRSFFRAALYGLPNGSASRLSNISAFAASLAAPMAALRAARARAHASSRRSSSASSLRRRR
ncbi:unnamed protein product [Chrysodeixis includens]|uniref:Uncharacterized protein n=1 Tax=Chrysodeixis includens TaxID=689277 RepID=A0A9N8PZW2_CHRIL|nr:unnamed protein product [Chrysodeixis includens]